MTEQPMLEWFETPYGREYQCGACKGEIDWEDCWQCGGEGGNDEYDDDPINFGPGECWNPCRECQGKGGWNVCLSCKKWLEGERQAQ